MTVSLTGDYGGAGASSVSLAAALTRTDHNLSYADLERVVESSGGSLGSFRAEHLVSAGFSHADAQRIMQGLGEDFAATRAGSRVLCVDLTRRAAPEECFDTPSADAFAGLGLAFAADVATIDQRCVFAEAPVAPLAPGTASTDKACAPAPAHWQPVTIEQRQGNLLALQEAGVAMLQRTPPADGITVWSDLTDMAARQYADTGLPAATQADFVMQDLAIVLMGPDARNRLEQYQDAVASLNDSLSPLKVKPDPLVLGFLDDYAALGLTTGDDAAWRSAGYMGGDLDPTGGKAFRPEINDGSNNQVHHTYFYQYLAYATNSRIAPEAASLGHELRDSGSSQEDHNAGMLGRSMGTFLRSMREQGTGPASWGTINAAAYGADGGPRLAAHPDDPVAVGVDDVAGALLSGGESLFDGARWWLENQAIQWVNK